MRNLYCFIILPDHLPKRFRFQRHDEFHAENLKEWDILAIGTPLEIYQATREMISNVTDRQKISWSCGLGIP